MRSIFIKEIKQFFSSPIAYLAMGFFFVLSALFLWFIPGSNYYIPTYHFANLTPFFELAPWILIFVVAAISMKSFSEEFKSGTIETILTKPLSSYQIVLGKFLSIWLLGILMLLPTFIYVYSIQQLSIDTQIDIKQIISGYIGLILLMANFSALGIFASSLFKNQVNAFLTGLFLMFLFYYGLDGLGNFNLLGNLDLMIKKLSLDFHYQNFIKGLMRLSDLIYLLSITLFFIILTNYNLQNHMK